MEITALNYKKGIVEANNSDISLNCDSFNEFEILLRTNITLTLQNIYSNKELTIWFKQDNTGNRTVTFSNQFTFSDTSTIVSSANSTTVMKFEISEGKCYCVHNSNAASGGDETFGTVTATTGLITTLDTNVAAAGVTLAGTTLAADGTDAHIPITITPKGTAGILTGVGSAAKPAYSFTADPDTGIIQSAANSLGFVTNATEHWSINASGALNPATDNSKDIGNEAVNPRDITASRQFIKKGIDTGGGYGLLALKSFSITQAVSGTASNFAITMPTGSMILATQLRNDTTILGADDSEPSDALVNYTAAYQAGVTAQNISATITLAANNKVNTFFDVNAGSNITTGAVNIRLTPNAVGGGTMSFTSGTVTIVVYYYELTSLTSI